MENNVEKIDLDHVDWKSSREFFDSLGEALDKLDDKDESYDFTWVGKRKSIIEAGAPINKTLRPDIEASKDFNNTKNMLIVGDNLDALKLLQESYLGKIKMIYIDPPYNTGHDFVYHDNFTIKKDDYTDSSTGDDGVKLVSEDEFTENSKANGRFHSDWLNMIYPRLKLARNLLTDDGVIFISIDDNEQANLKKVCDEIFGEDNFVASFIWNKQHSQQQGIIKRYHETVYLYGRNTSKLKNIRGGDGVIEAGALKKISKANPESDFTFPAGVKCEAANGTNFVGTYGDSEKITVKNGIFSVRDGETTSEMTLSAGWTQKNQMRDFFNGNDVLDSKGQKIIEFYFNSTGKLKCRKERSSITPPSILPLYGMVSESTDQLSDLLGGHFFESPKPTNMIKDFLSWFSNENDLILDFFAGSGTTGHAVMDLNAEDGGNRKYILVQLDEKTDEKSEAKKAGYDTIDQITAERIRRAGDKIEKEHPEAKIDTGFRVFRIDDSNEKDDIRKPLGEIQQSNIFDMVDNVKTDRTPLDLLFGVVYASALPFDLKLETRKIGDNTVYLYGYLDEGTGLVACFDDKVPEDTIKEIAELKALTAAFKDSSFADSAEKINLSEHFRIISPETKVKVI